MIRVHNVTCVSDIFQSDITPWNVSDLYHVYLEPVVVYYQEQDRHIFERVDAILIPIKDGEEPTGWEGDIFDLSMYFALKKGHEEGEV